jgi:hypothetical protein
MSVPFRVDLNSAVVTYRPAAGEERSVTAQEATPNGRAAAADKVRREHTAVTAHHQTPFTGKPRG